MQLELTADSDGKSHKIYFTHNCDETGWCGSIIVSPLNGKGDDIIFPLNGPLLTYIEAWATASIDNNKD